MNSFPLYYERLEELNLVAYCFGEPVNSKSFSSSQLQLILGKLPKGVDIWLNPSLKNILANSAYLNIYYPWAIVPHRLWYLVPQSSLVFLEYQTTAQLAISVAFSYGYEEVELYGFDHDWLASPDYSKHFYSDKKEATDTLSDFSYMEILDLVSNMWRIYKAQRMLATKRKVRVSNKSSKSFLDVFDI